MGAVKEKLLNNIPYRQPLEEALETPPWMDDEPMTDERYQEMSDEVL